MAHGTGDRFVVGVTGHRDLAGAEDGIASALRADLEARQGTHGDHLIALSAIAAGADSLFAEAAISLGIPLEVVLPFEGYVEDFEEGAERERFQALLAAARIARTLPYQGRSAEAYAAVGRWVVKHSDHLVAVWDGMPARGRGGTGDIVAYARGRGHPVTVITPPQT